MAEPPDGGSPASAISVAPQASVAPPVPSAEAPLPETDECKRRLQKVSFLECNPQPAQRDYPECWTYDIEPVEEKSNDRDRCLPTHVTIGISGWQAVLDSLRAKVVYNAARPDEAILKLERVETSMLGFSGRPGVVLGTLVFKDGAVHELRFGPGMPSRTRRRSLFAAPSL